MNSPLRQRSVHLVKRGTLLDRLRRAGFAPAAQPPFTPAFGADASLARPLPSCFALLPRRSHPTLMNTYKNAKHMLCIRSASSVTERVGFEPTRRFPDDRISSAARYDHFDTSPLICKRYYTAVAALLSTPQPFPLRPGCHRLLPETLPLRYLPL